MEGAESDPGQAGGPSTGRLMRIIAGRWRGHPIQAPPTGTRPTSDRVREAWMSMMQPVLADARVLDLFAGSGGLGLEALSRGARHATFVERAGGAVRVLRANIQRLDAGPLTTVVRGDARRYVADLRPDRFDLVLADPPYGSGDARVLAEGFLLRPYARILWIEHRVDDPLPESDAADTRRYGDTLLTRYMAPE
jgi:16S rRNA (guanine966-N2)-methyltransferase